MLISKLGMEFLLFLLLLMFTLLTDAGQVNLGLLVPHSGPRAFGQAAVNVTIEMAMKKVCNLFPK